MGYQLLVNIHSDYTVENSLRSHLLISVLIDARYRWFGTEASLSSPRRPPFLPLAVPPQSHISLSPSRSTRPGLIVI